MLQTNVKDGRVPEKTLYKGVTARLIATGYVSARSSLQVVYDFPGELDFYRGLMEYADRLDAAILVVCVLEGVNAITRKHARLAAEFGIPRVAVFLNTEMVESDRAKIIKVNQDVVALLKENGYTEGQLYSVAGLIPTTVEAARDNQISLGIDHLLGRLERWPLRSELDRQPVRFPVVGAFEITDKGMPVIGYVEQGRIVIGQRLDVVGHGSGAQVIVEGRFDVPGLDTDELTGLWIRSAEGVSIQSGHVLSAPGTLEASKAFESSIYFLPNQEGAALSLFSPIPADASSTPRAVFQYGGAPGFYFRASSVPPARMSMNYSQPISTAQITLGTDIALYRGQRFRIVGDDGKIIGSGVVTKIIE